MSDAYDVLVRTGFVGSLKRDVLIEASRDIEYLSHIRSRFQHAGKAAQEAANDCTVRFIEEMTEHGLCVVARWSKEEKSGHKVIECDRAKLEEFLDEANDEPWASFLVATDTAREWLRRYFELIAELSDRPG